jgi:hypothetical protein
MARSIERAKHFQKTLWQAAGWEWTEATFDYRLGVPGKSFTYEVPSQVQLATSAASRLVQKVQVRPQLEYYAAFFSAGRTLRSIFGSRFCLASLASSIVRP